MAASRPTPLPLIFPTRPPESSPPEPESRFETPSPLSLSPASGGGKIAYVCQIFRVPESDQICIMDSDGTNQRRLTTSDTARHYYPSLAPDGQSVLFSSNMDGTNFYIYELKLTGELTNLWRPGVAPEVSPDGRLIAFAQSDGKNNMIMVMNRDGSNPRLLTSNGWDPTWSPDGQKILFASQVGGLSQLMTINLDGSGLQQVSDLPLLRGRSDWSSDGRHLVTYSGRSWERELFIIPLDGSPVRQLTPPGGNSQGPTFSPDGQWVAFTAYFDRFRNVHGCEIYKMRIDGTGLTRLTNNDYCDWQPRWGP
ncbi:MAG: hypothetical protein Fur0016_05100 [Anaerolineales bacterium]